MSDSHVATPAKLAVREKLSYGCGDLASCLFWQSFSLFLVLFYTDVFGLPAAVVGTMLFITHLANTVIDPGIGILADRTNTRWGKFRPWLLTMAVPFGVIGLLSFTTPDLSLTGKIVYAYVTHLLMCIIYSAINVPYSALMGVMTPSSTDRTSLSSYRFVFAFVAGLIVSGATFPLVERFGGSNEQVVSADLDEQAVKLKLTERGAIGTVKVVVSAIDTDKGEETATEKGMRFFRQLFLKEPAPTTAAYVRVYSKDELPPAIDEKLPDLDLQAGFGGHQLELSKAFKRRGGKSLTVKAASNNDDVVTVDNNNGVLVEKNTGVAKITVTADNGEAVTEKQAFLVRVSAPGNRPPQYAGKLADIELKQGFGKHRQELQDLFTDADNDKLKYTVSLDNATVVKAGVDGSTLVIHEDYPGAVKMKIVADDGRGGQAECSAMIRVAGKPVDGKPFTPITLLRPLGNVHKDVGFATHELDLNGLFDPGTASQVKLTVNVVNEAKGFQFTMGVYAVMATLLFLITFAGTRERVRPSAKQRTSLSRDFKDLLTNVPWIVLCFVGIATLTFVSIRNAAIVYYLKYCVGSLTMATAFLFAAKISTIIGVMLTNWFVKFLGKKTTYLASMGLGGLLTLVFYFIPDEQLGLLFVLNTLLMFIWGPTAPLVWAMYADSADYSEWRTGRRATGLVFSAASFSQKLGWAIGGAFVGWLLFLFGFVANVEQSASSVLGIRLMFSFIPAGIALFAAVLMFLYRLDDKTMRGIEGELAARKAAADDNPAE